MYKGHFDLSFVIVFILYKNQVLLLKRKKDPWQNKWNGVGGKIEANEPPLAASIREVEEETGIVLTEKQIKFTGIVTWEKEIREPYRRGMFTYVATLTELDKKGKDERLIKEGTLAWKPFSWALDKTNEKIADNIPYFLPPMLQMNKPHLYNCLFADNKLQTVTQFPLPEIIADIV